MVSWGGLFSLSSGHLLLLFSVSQGGLSGSKCPDAQQKDTSNGRVEPTPLNGTPTSTCPQISTPFEGPGSSGVWVIKRKSRMGIPGSNFLRQVASGDSSSFVSCLGRGGGEILSFKDWMCLGGCLWVGRWGSLASHPRQAGSAPLEKATVGPPTAAHVSAPWEGRGGFLGDVFSLKAAASRPELDATYFQPASGLDHAGVSCYRTWTQKSQGLLSVSKQSQKGFP